MPYYLTIFCDGACRGNGQSNAIGAAGISIVRRSGERNGWWRKLPQYPTPTNQRAELLSLAFALEKAIEIRDDLYNSPYFDLTLKTDSKYAVDCMTTWIAKWRENGFTNVKGAELAGVVLALEEAIDIRDSLHSSPYFDLILKTDSKYAVDILRFRINTWIRSNFSSTLGSQVTESDILEDIKKLSGNICRGGGSVSITLIQSELNGEAYNAASLGCDQALQEREVAVERDVVTE
ncbi:ribonuclease HI, partial [Phenoliferia sp. Uapishka_3]